MNISEDLRREAMAAPDDHEWDRVASVMHRAANLLDAAEEVVDAARASGEVDYSLDENGEIETRHDSRLAKAIDAYDVHR